MEGIQQVAKDWRVAALKWSSSKTKTLTKDSQQTQNSAVWLSHSQPFGTSNTDHTSDRSQQTELLHIQNVQTSTITNLQLWSGTNSVYDTEVSNWSSFKTNWVANRDSYILNSVETETNWKRQLISSYRLEYRFKLWKQRRRWRISLRTKFSPNHIMFNLQFVYLMTYTLLALRCIGCQGYEITVYSSVYCVR